MVNERFKLIPTSHLILIKNNEILLSRRFNTGYEDGNYSVAAGHLDGDETFIQAMIREAKEEIGVDIKPKDLEVIHVMHRKVPNEERIDFFIIARQWKGEPKIMELHKCDHLEWYKLDKLPQNTIPYVRQAIEFIKNNIFYSEYGWKNMNPRTTTSTNFINRREARCSFGVGVKIAIISDTHDNIQTLKKAADWIKQEKIKTIIHCGDIFKAETIKEGLKGFKGEIRLIFSPADASFSKPGMTTLTGFSKRKSLFAKRVKVALPGKIPEDSFKSIKGARVFSEFGELAVGGKRIAFCHFPEIAEKLVATKEYDLIFYGHTHKPWEERMGKTRLVNPGNLAGIFYKPTFAVYDAQTDKLELKILGKL